MSLLHTIGPDLERRYGARIPTHAWLDASQPHNFPDATLEEIEATIAGCRERVTSSENKIGLTREGIEWARTHAPTGLSVVIAGERLEIAQRQLRDRENLLEAWLAYRDERLAREGVAQEAAE